MGIRTGNPTWVDRPDTSTPITAQALNNIENALDSIGGGGGTTGLLQMVRGAEYGPGGGYGWALRMYNLPDGIETTGTHDAGITTSAATADARARYEVKWLPEGPVGSVYVFRFALTNITNTRNWVGSALGDFDAEMPFSHAHMSGAKLALRASPFDGDTTFKAIAGDQVVDTGVTIDTNWHEVRFERFASKWTIGMDGGTPIDMTGHAFWLSPQLVSITKAAVATSIRMERIRIFEPSGLAYYE